jgi:hypothetical protein
VISPTPSKNVLRDSTVVLNERFPTHTEFRRFELTTLLPVFCFFFEDGLLKSESFSVFLFRRLCSACERTGRSPSESESESDTLSTFSPPLSLLGEDELSESDEVEEEDMSGNLQETICIITGACAYNRNMVILINEE